MYIMISVPMKVSKRMQTSAVAYNKCKVFVGAYNDLPANVNRRSTRAFFSSSPAPLLTDKEVESYKKNQESENSCVLLLYAID